VPQKVKRDSILKAVSPIKALFVCGRNQRRSPTAERIFKDDPRLSVRSAGVMEPKHAARIRFQFTAESIPPMRSLDIPDDYEYMDSELVELLRTAAE